MKIALIFSGRINKNKQQYQNIKDNIIQDNNYDIFIIYPKNTPQKLINKVSNLYQPKIIIENTETYFNVDKYKKRKETNKHNTMCMYLGRNILGNKFFEYISKNSIHYDLVISIRMDLIFHNKLNYQILNDILKNENQDLLFIPNPEYDYKGINDQMAIGKQNSIIKYLQVYQYLYNILEYGTLFNPEIILKKYLDNNTIKIIRFIIKYNIQKY